MKMDHDFGPKKIAEYNARKTKPFFERMHAEVWIIAGVLIAVWLPLLRRFIIDVFD